MSIITYRLYLGITIELEGKGNEVGARTSVVPFYGGMIQLTNVCCEWLDGLMTWWTGVLGPSSS